MKKICDGFWMHRCTAIFQDEQGIYVDGHLHLFKTLTDAVIYIDKGHSQQAYAKWNGRVPTIVGEWHI